MYVISSAKGWDKYLSEADIDDILGRNDTGVLALATRNRPYATPVSFGPREDDLVQFGQAKRPLYDMWDECLNGLNIQLVKITQNTLTGRRLPFDDRADETIAN